MKNADLQEHYEAGHAYTSDGQEEADGIVASASWVGKKVLEIGCGGGELGERIFALGADYTGIDYAIKGEYVEPGLEFKKCDYLDMYGHFDVVVMQGVLEHMDHPGVTLGLIKDKFTPEQIVTSSPNFLNPRGHVWMALQLLLDVPMSLTDLHFICPFDMKEWAQELGCGLEYRSVDQDWGHGQLLLTDYEKRLKNALKDRGLEADVPNYLSWLRKTLPYRNYTESSGATIVYNLIF
jgi:SAM-dependent methyltransferase